ncbi:MAG: hypothetical protein R2818_07150 [Flavobacteriales bacterium]
MARRILIAVLALLLAPWAIAQGDPLVEALRKYQAGELEKARELIDLAVQAPDHATDPEAWLLRGFVYKDAYKSASTTTLADEFRDEAIVSLFSCMGLDSAGTYRDNAKQAYDFLTRSYFNDAAKALNEMDDVRAVHMFEQYEDATLKLNPDADLRLRKIEFKNALGTVFTKRFNMDRTNLEWFDRAVEAYKEVIAIDADNYGANYNLATLYYNRGVYNIQGINADDEIPTILQIQEVSREFFQEALPYMLKAHDMNPTRRETLLGLEGIYYSLQDQQSSDKFRELFEELPPEEDR